ncbi:MAG: hypothetical protein M0R03_23695 [Novosphingobium sp.]|nr:hypothetical protein [Novosphingobium sp.]
MNKNIIIELDSENNISIITIKDDKNNIEHTFFEEPKEEQENYYSMTLREIIKDYVNYFENNKEEQKNTHLQEGEYMIYKGVIAFIDEPNDDLPTSNNIQFFKYKEGKTDLYDYDIDDDRLDYCGLLTEEQNIKNYIDESLI